MPSPFPGMDPYLENPGLWPDVHHELISTARRRLAAPLRPSYAVRIEERVYLCDERDPGRDALGLGLEVAETPELRPPVGPSAGAATGVAEPIVAITFLDKQIREARLEIIDRGDHQVVAVVEILSPVNKVSGAKGRASFQQKRSELMNSPSHWVEIDLLRGGEPMRFRGNLGPRHYLAHVSNVMRRPRGLLWPIRLDQRLPVIPVPLKEEDPPVPLDLQEILTDAYDGARFGRRIDYRAEPVPPLPAEWSDWADRRLREKGLRA